MGTVADELVQVVRLLVDQPREARVDAVEAGEGEVDLELRLAADDRGKVIGRRGRTIDALRALADSRGDRDGLSYAVEIVEE